MLVYILYKGEVGSMDFDWLTSNWRTIDENLTDMVESRLLEIHIPNKGRKAIRYSLTDTGKWIAMMELMQRERLRGNQNINDDIIQNDMMRLWDGIFKNRKPNCDHAE